MVFIHNFSWTGLSYNLPWNKSMFFFQKIQRRISRTLWNMSDEASWENELFVVISFHKKTPYFMFRIVLNKSFVWPQYLWTTFWASSFRCSFVDHIWYLESCFEEFLVKTVIVFYFKFLRDSSNFKRFLLTRDLELTLEHFLRLAESVFPFEWYDDHVFPFTSSHRI